MCTLYGRNLSNKYRLSGTALIINPTYVPVPGSEKVNITTNWSPHVPT